MKTETRYLYRPGRLDTLMIRGYPSDLAMIVSMLDSSWKYCSRLRYWLAKWLHI